MTILLEQCYLPERGTVEINVKQAFEILVTAEEARRQVHLWLLDEVSCMMGAEPPTLVIGERIVWRVPVHFSAPPVGIVGTVGMVDVDVQTGEKINTPFCKSAIENRATELVTKLPPFQLFQAVPEACIPKHIPHATLLELPEDEPILTLAADD